MPKKQFHSELFGRIIESNDKDYWQIVYAEAVYRYYDLVERNCTCFECKNRIEKLSDYLKTHKSNKRRIEHP